MSQPHFSLLLCSLLVTGMAMAWVPATLAASQDPPPVQNTLFANPDAQEEDPVISRSSASDRARNAFPGRVLSIRLEAGKWRVRMDQEGTVFNVLVDSSTGEVKRSGE